MSYSQFTLAILEKTFQLKIVDKVAMFTKIPTVSISPWLTETLNYNVPLALANDTEKARSEMIVAPILIELKRQLPNQMSLFSGAEFKVDEDAGLTGYCDFIISRSPEQLFVKAPLIMLVEAKNDNIKSGLGQCVAEMLAAQLFNQREQNSITTIYGVVTTGALWKFLRLTDNQVEIDLREYHLSEIDQILGILQAAIKP
ncbi:hypothetical protein TI04_05130 [Achromatium sp. WMS2]|nr:hypothetical protein TI04_05130 [Achromatium sp. WMS2]